MIMKLKLKEKLLKLLSYRFRYYVRVEKAYFYKKNMKGYLLKVTDDYVTFYTNKIDIKNFDLEKIEIIDRFKQIGKKIIKEKVILLISILILMFMFIFSNFAIREVVFLDNVNYNHEVYQDVVAKLKKVGPIYFLNDDLNTISSELREKYNYYAYIGINKKGAKVIIDIKKPDEYPAIVDDETLGDLVANSGGQIIGIEVERGVVVAEIKQMVKKGDLLVSGNLLFLVNPNDTTRLVSAKGKVYATTVEYIEIIIDKKMTYEQYSGNNSSYYQIGFLKWLSKERNLYDNSYIKIEEKMKIGNIFLVNKIFEYEKREYHYVSNIDDGENLARLKIAYDFEVNRVNQMEKINHIELIKTNEDDDKYYFYFLVKSIKNIAVKKKYVE